MGLAARLLRAGRNVPDKVSTGSSFMARKKAVTRNGNRSHNANGTSSGWKKLQDGFSAFAQATSRITGRPSTFLLAVLIVVIWAVTGPFLGFSDTWQLV